jgi:hypothetical protein
LINLGRVSVVRAGVVSADTSLDEERKIAEKASAVLSSLGPLSPRNAEKLSVLSKAIFTATNKALSPARREAAATLDVIYELLGRGRLPQPASLGEDDPPGGTLKQWQSKSVF